MAEPGGHTSCSGRVATALGNISISIIISFCIAQSPHIPHVRPRAHYIVIISCYSEKYARLKRNVFSPRRKADVDCVLFSSIAAGSTLSVRRWKMLDPSFSGLSVGRRSLWDWRSAVRSGLKWKRLAGASTWCSLVIVQVMPCGRENTAYTLYTIRSLTGSQYRPTLYNIILICIILFVSL